MRALRFLALGLLLSSTAFAGRIGLSAVRYENEEHFDAAFRNNDFTPMGRTPQRMSKSLRDLDLTQIPDVGSYADLENQFVHVRDNRLLEDGYHNMQRRLTWLYPDDGCYARAEMASHMLEDAHFVVPKKVFVFGNLRALTKNAPGGSVSWWYHVAVTYRIDKTVYVLDPALNPAKPLTLQEWHAAVGGNTTKVTYAICNHNTFDPNMDCENPAGVPLQEAMSEQTSFLPDEWSRLLELNRDPSKELGEFPPWSR